MNVCFEKIRQNQCLIDIIKRAVFLRLSVRHYPKHILIYCPYTVHCAINFFYVDLFNYATINFL